MLKDLDFFPHELYLHSNLLDDPDTSEFFTLAENTRIYSEDEMEYFVKDSDRTLTISAEAPSETVPVVGDIIRDSHEIARVTTASSGTVWATRTVNTLQFGSDSNAMISE